MIDIVLLVLASAVVMTFSAYSSYCLRESHWYLPCMLGSTTVLGLIWAVLCWRLDSTGHITVASVIWDVGCVCVYALFPVFYLSYQPSPQVWVGMALAVAGIICMSCGVRP